MTWKPVTRDSIPGVRMGLFLWCNLTIPKLWAIRRETSTQSQRPRGPTQVIRVCLQAPGWPQTVLFPCCHQRAPQASPSASLHTRDRWQKVWFLRSLIYQS